MSPTPLEELIDRASGDETPVSTLLRKVKVIAARTRTGDLEAWVEHELVGYPDDVELPAYRGPFDAQVLGNFAGYFNSQYTNAIIPPGHLPETLRDRLSTNRFRQPIAELEMLAKAEKPLHTPWAADLVSHVNSLISKGEVDLYDDMMIQSAWRVVSPAHLEALIDSVRTRILDLALSLEQVAPHAGEPNAPAPDDQVMQQIVTNVYAPSNISVAGRDFEQSLQMVTQGDLDGLVRYLRDQGLDESYTNDLKDAIEADGGTSLGNHAQAWLGQVMLSGSTAAAGALGTTAAKALARFFGIG